jgi:CRP-like cAMP-binding protein
MMGHLANTLIFSMVGIIVVDVLVLIESETTCSVAGQDGLDLMTTLGKAMILYVLLTLIRGTSTFVMKPFMRQKSKQFDVTYKEVLVMTWGGLRGAVSLCLAISLLSGTASGPLSCAYKMAANEIMLITTVVVLCTLVINATTIKWMLNSLGMLEITRNMHQNMMSAVFDLREDTGRQITTFRYDPFLSDASWPMVNDQTATDYPYSGGEPDLADLMNVKCDEEGHPIESQIEAEVKDSEVHENIVERGLKALKLFYSSQFAEGTVDENVYNVLENHVSKALNECRFIRRSDIEKYWRVKGFAPFIKKKVEGLMFDDRKKNKRCPWTTKFMKNLYKFAKSDGFDYFMQFIVFVNMPLIFWELRVDLEHVPCAYEASSYNITCPDTGVKFMESTVLCSMTPIEEEVLERMVTPGEIGRAVNETVALDECYGYNSKNAVLWQMITMANLFFIGFYTLEFLIKIIGLGAKQYFTDPWNDFDFLVFIIGLFDLLVICTVFFGVSGDQTGGSMVDNVMKMFKGLKLLKFTKAIKALKFLRALRALKFLKTILPMTIETCERQIHRDLSFGYQIGRCYIRGQDELHKLLPKFVEAGHNGVLNKYLDEAEANRLEVHRELGVLQRDMPGLAISIKTKTACRTILNTQKSKVEKYLSGGVLDEHEAKLLKKNIEKGMKDIAYGFPVQVCPPKDLDMILNIPWLNLENKELVNYMKKFAEQIDFDCGDILIQEGEEVDGIYLIINGMVRISGSGMFVDEETNGNKADDKYVDPDEVDENRDIYSSKNRFDYVCSGGLVGEIGCLVKGPATVTAECETAVTAFLIKVEDIEAAFDQFISLKQQIWRSYSISQAMKVIGKELLEFGSSPEQQRQYLDPGFVKELSRNEQLMFDETIEAVIVVYGKVKVSCASKRHQNIFKTYEGKAVSVIKQIHDKNSFKLIEQIISPIYESDTTELPKLLVIPSEGNGTDGMNTDILERMTQIAKAGYGPMNAFSQFQGFSRPTLISAPNRPSLAGAQFKQNQVRPTVLKNYANQRPVLPTVITETDE